MAGPDTNENLYEHHIRVVRVAKGLEANGLYNAAKLFWAAAASEEVRASDARGIPKAAHELVSEMETAIATLESKGAEPELIEAMRLGQDVVHAQRTILHNEIPHVYVCRACGETILGNAPYHCGNCGAWELTLREIPAVYFLDPVTPEKAISALAATPGMLDNMTDTLSEEQLNQPPEPGEWSMRETMHHLLLAQGLLEGRVEKMQAEENPSLASVAAWTMVGEGESLSSQDILERFNTSRQKTLDMLNGMAAEAWWRTGRHDEFGEVTILQQASYFARHDQSHLLQISEARAALST